MTVTSANINDLQTFLTGSQTRYERLAETLTTVTNKANVVMPACGGSEFPSTPSLGSLSQLVGAWQVNQAFVQVVRNELIEADQIGADGMATVASTEIDATLQANGLDQAPGLVEVPEIELYGQPPYSGFVDDPICLANGNFLLRDGDLELFGVAAPLSVVRTYNSRDHRAGAFGPGWSSAVDVALDVHDREVTFRAADGSGAVFRLLADGTWSENRRRRLTLGATDAGGWLVREGHDRTWHFDGDGRCTAFTAAGADVSVGWEADAVRLTDHTSGRWVSYRRHTGSGLVTSAETSDGRTATYEHDDHGRVVGVRRDRGDVAYEHDDHGFLAGVIDADGIVVCRNVYDGAGRVLSQVENHGRETRYEYRADGVSTVTASDDAPPNVMVHDRRGRMTAMIDGLGNTMRIAYDDHDDVVQIVDRAGAVTRYDHDERGNLVARIDPDGLAHRYEWDAHDRLVADTNRAGATTRYRYAGDRRVPARVVQADGTEVLATYDDLDLPTSIIDPDGVSGEVVWNRDGLAAEIVDGLGGRITFTYDAAGRSVGAEAPEGIRAAVDLDPAGRVLALRTADGERGFAYSAAGRVIGGRQDDGATWQAALDAAGDLSVVTDATGQAVTVERDTVGRVSATIAADGARTSFEFDPVGRRTATIDPLGNRTEVGYDPEGRPLQLTDASGRTRSRDLDILGRTTMAVGPDGGTSIRSYHAHGALASTTDPAGNQWSYDVDVMGRVTASTDPLGNVTTYRYTPGGRLSEVVSPLGRSERREYDRAGRLVRIIEADGTVVQFDRRADGAPRRITRAGLVTALDYDESGRASAIAGPWSSLSVEREAGRISSLSTRGTDPAQVSYDPRGMLARVVDPAGVVTEFTRDRCGRLVGHTTGGAGSEFGWDGAGRLTSVTDAYGNRTAFDRDPRGVIERVTRPDGSATVRTFDAGGRVVAAHEADGTELVAIRRDANGAIVDAAGGGARLSLRRDPLGRVTEVTTDAGTVDYTWDADSLVQQVTDRSGWTVAVERDDAGRTVGFRLADGRTVERPSAPVQERDEHGRIVVDELGRSYGYDTAGRLAAATVDGRTTTYDYDDLGLLAREQSPAGARRYRYGQAGELTTQIHADGSETRFTYDATGRRTGEAHTDGSTVAYRWDGLGRLVGVVRTAADGTETDHRITVDPVGRPALVDDVPVLWDSAATGSVIGVGAERYLWWGNQVLATSDPDAGWSRRIGGDPWGDDGGTGLRLGYRGELALDHLVFLGARVYDTRTRTFLSRDPLPSVPGTVSFAGVYAYASCDPVNLVDPSGQRPLSDDEYADFREQASKGVFRQAWDAVAEDPWGWAAKGLILVGGIVITAVAVATLGPVGVILIGAAVGAVSGGLNAAIDGGDWGDIGRAALIGGVFGAATGGLAKFVPPSAATSVGTRLLQNTGSQGLQNYGMASAQEAADSYLWGGDGTMNWENALINGTVGTVAGVGSAEVVYHQTHQTTGVNTGGADPDAPTGGPGSGLDDLDPPTMGHDSPEAALPDPDRALDSFNGATAEQLQEAHGIGPVTAQAIIDYREANGGFTTAADVLEVTGVGPARLQALQDAGLLP